MYKYILKSYFGAKKYYILMKYFLLLFLNSMINCAQEDKEQKHKWGQI